jgi:transcription elongation factor Elf1
MKRHDTKVVDEFDYNGGSLDWQCPVCGAANSVSDAWECCDSTSEELNTSAECESCGHEFDLTGALHVSVSCLSLVAKCIHTPESRAKENAGWEARRREIVATTASAEALKGVRDA